MSGENGTSTAVITLGPNPTLGIGLALASTIFIGASFIVKKKALIRLQANGGLRAGAGGLGYLKEWVWWAGLICMGIGELANFAAYAFAPASLVTPLGALSVLVSAILASKFLHERMNLLGKLGCWLCIIGSTVIVLHSPKSSEINGNFKSPEFLIYVIFIFIYTLYVAFIYGPRHGHKNVLIYTGLCSMVGSLSVMACKAFGVSLREALNGEEIDAASMLFYFMVVICLIVTQMNYLNKVLDIFSMGVVTPVYYVLFTSFTICASMILFDEWRNVGCEDVVGALCGFLTVVIAIYLITAFKGDDGGKVFEKT